MRRKKKPYISDEKVQVHLYRYQVKIIMDALTAYQGNIPDGLDSGTIDDTDVVVFDRTKEKFYLLACEKGWQND